jgi:rare lipoprotein A
VVRINDRGPFVKSRIIDLSHAAAVRLGMTGVTPVTLEVVETPPLDPRLPL